jgi:uncharacterized protein YjdB
MLALLALAVVSCGDNIVVAGPFQAARPRLPPIDTILLTPTSVHGLVGQTLQFTAEPVDAAGTPLQGRIIVWTTTDSAVAVVDSTGFARWLAPGSTYVVAGSLSKSTAATVTVISPPVAQVIVLPAIASAPPGQWAQFSASVRDANDSLLSGQPVRWTSADTAVATVDQNGRATVFGVGTDTIRATSGTVTGTALLRVVADTASQPPPPPPSPPAVASVTVTPAQATVAVPGTIQLYAVARDSAGSALSGFSVGWTSSDTTLAGITPGGLVSALAPGSVTITATVAGHAGTSQITVAPDTAFAAPPPPTTEPTPNGGTVIWHDDFNGGLLGTVLTDAQLLVNYDVLGAAFIHADSTGGLGGSGAARIDWVRSTACQDASRVLEREFPATQDVYAQYDIRYTTGFIFDWTDSGQSPCTGNAKKLFFFYAGSGSGTSRFDFIAENHTLGMGGDFDHPLFQQTAGPAMSLADFGDGSWHRVTIHVRQSSTPTTADGFIYGWIDGVLRWAVPEWASGSSGGWIYFDLPTTFNQGSPADQSEWIDNLTIWHR